MRGQRGSETRGFWDRPTSDIIVLLLTIVIVIAVVISIVGIVMAGIFGKSIDIDVLATRVGNIITSLIGAVVGFLAGRGTAPRVEAPAEPPRHPPAE